MTDAADPDHDGRRAGHGEVRQPPHRVVGGQAGIGVRRDGDRLDAGRQGMSDRSDTST